MKTLDEIISRKDYSRMTVQLCERVNELAAKVRDKMLELDLTDEYEPARGVVLTIVQGRTNVGGYDYLAIVDDDTRYCIDGRYSGYIHGDFHHSAVSASNAQYLAFLNAAQNIMEWLDKVESEQVKEIEDAINGAKDL